MTAATGFENALPALEALPDIELVHRYRRGLELLDARIFELSDEELDRAFLPEANVGRWPVRVLLGHLADAELAYSHRMRRAVGEDHPLLAPWDPDAFIDAGIYGGTSGGAMYPIAGFIAVIHHLRRWTAAWLLTLMPEQFQRTAMHPERGEMTVKRILATATWHLEHHGEYCNRKVCKMLGPRPAEPTPSDQPATSGKAGGCGPGCGCRPRG